MYHPRAKAHIFVTFLSHHRMQNASQTAVTHTLKQTQHMHKLNVATKMQPAKTRAQSTEF
eukprot:m.130625 g.130625  ORF g.130625 m.130625 type:complete len:60 (+) comp13906_c0_seq1:1495-1674(+)